MSKERQNAYQLHRHRWMLALTVAYMIDGKTKKEVADLLSVNEKSVASWLNKSPLVWEQLQAYVRALIDFPFKDNLSIFMAYVMLKQPKAYRGMSEFYLKYIAPFRIANIHRGKTTKEIVLLVNKGYSQRDISEHMGIDIKTVAAWIDKAFVLRDAPNESLEQFFWVLEVRQNRLYNMLWPLYNEYIAVYKKANTPHLQQVRETITLFKSGVQKKKIAKQFGVNEKTVARWINEYGYLA